MIYFIEHDSAENICHVCSDPMATIVPLVNRVTFNDADNKPMKDSNGNDLSTNGLALSPPAAISVADFNTLMADGISNYTFDPTAGSIVKRPAPTPAATGATTSA